MIDVVTLVLARKYADKLIATGGNPEAAKQFIQEEVSKYLENIDSELDKLKAIDQQIQDLENQISNIQSKPGLPGPPGLNGVGVTNIAASWLENNQLQFTFTMSDTTEKSVIVEGEFKCNCDCCNPDNPPDEPKTFYIYYGTSQIDTVNSLEDIENLGLNKLETTELVSSFTTKLMENPAYAWYILPKDMGYVTFVDTKTNFTYAMEGLVENTGDEPVVIGDYRLYRSDHKIGQYSTTVSVRKV